MSTPRTDLQEQLRLKRILWLVAFLAFAFGSAATFAVMAAINFARAFLK